MKLFFNVKFTGLQLNTDVISLGIVSEDNKKFYGMCNDYSRDKIDDWTYKNVVTNICVDYAPLEEGDLAIGANTSIIANDLQDWIARNFQDENIVFVGDCAHYGYCLLIDLLSKTGNALDLPKNISIAYHDINTDIARKFILDDFDADKVVRSSILDKAGIKVKGVKYNALYDAEVIKEVYNLTNNDENLKTPLDFLKYNVLSGYDKSSKYFAVKIYNGFTDSCEIIINTMDNMIYNDKLNYYLRAYNEKLELKTQSKIKIIKYYHGSDLETIFKALNY